MKTMPPRKSQTILVIVFWLFAVPTLFQFVWAKDVPTYDQTGILQFRKFATTYSYLGRDHSSSFHCDSLGGDVSCEDGPGSAYFVASEHSTWHFVIGEPWGEAVGRTPLDAVPPEGKKVQFRLAYGHYRFDSFRIELICMPYDVLDKNGNVKKQKEACWRTVFPPSKNQ